MPRSIFAIASDHLACLAQLQAAGFRADEISWFASDGRPGLTPVGRPSDIDTEANGLGAHLATTEEISAPSDALPATSIAWLPVVGTILASGPLSLLLSGRQSLIKLLSELGVPAYAVLRYEDALARGAAVVAVHTDNGFEVETVSQILRDGGCEQVAAA